LLDGSPAAGDGAAAEGEVVGDGTEAVSITDVAEEDVAVGRRQLGGEHFEEDGGLGGGG
jgi:hypothetical protein